MKEAIKSVGVDAYLTAWILSEETEEFWIVAFIISMMGVIENRAYYKNNEQEIKSSDFIDYICVTIQSHNT